MNPLPIDVSVVLISWKMKVMLEAMLDSICQHTTGVSYELIIVDNDSRDGTSEMVRTRFPDAILIQNPVNRGVAPSRNQAFHIARGRYIVTLDADMKLQENSLKKMVEFMDSTPDAGLCGCKLVFEDGRIQPSGRRYPTPVAYILRRMESFSFARNSRSLRNHEMAEWDRSDIRSVDYVIGACQFIRREAMDMIGHLDEQIFYGPEDIDYCLRMYRSGWKVYYFALTTIVHYEQRITKKKLFSRISWLHLKGVLYLFRKYNGSLTR